MGCKLSRSITSDVSKSNSRRVCRGPGALDTAWVRACELASEYEASMMPFDVEIIKKERDVLKAQVKNLSEDLDDFKRELTDRSNALEATKQDWLEACETITKLEADATDYDRVRDYERIKKLEADKALAVEALKYYGAAVNWQDYYYDSGDEPGDIQMAIDFEDVDYERDSTGDIIFSCGGKLARKALKKLEAAE
jgi:hypothetical protein